MESIHKSIKELGLDKKEISFVCYGDVIKLRHKNTGKRLHSHPLNYNTGSKQQEVTGFDGNDDNDWWVVHGPHKDGDRENCKKAKAVKPGDIIRLEHLKTGKNLHSHGNFNSPSTNQQEITCYGNLGVGDGNDNWKLEFKETKKLKWKPNMAITLTHVNTGAKLHSHSGQQTKVSHQQEVTGYKGGDANDDWVLDALI
ncbi:hypothetical protein M0811_05645 [Anaeramoeba ignava]|uniref:MIR domain-containing protein n=1 Tax=Anaeramoeba ignava TaxID=1746090 RepID=A0A9Q0REB5_ANAIG|nr:hypothetical protein M0811_05645 [Anaeramoeba ignava]